MAVSAAVFYARRTRRHARQRTEFRSWKYWVKSIRQCGAPVNFPITARQGDIEAFQELLDIAKTYLLENGVLADILERLMERIKQRLNLQ